MSLGMLYLLYLENSNFVYYFIICIVYVFHFILIFIVSLETYQLLCGGLTIEKKKS